MFKKLLMIVTALMLVFILVSPVQAASRDMWAQVYSWDGSINASGRLELTEITTGVIFQVLKTTNGLMETLTEYNDSTATSLTNPVSTTNYALGTVMKSAGVLSFRTDPTDAGDENVDLVVVDTAGGYTTFVEDFNRYDHTIIIDERPGIQHIGMVPVFFLAGGTEVDTGVDFDYHTLIHDVKAMVTVVDAAETIDIGTLSSGTAGDANGFRSLVSVATAGIPTDTAVITAGTNLDYSPVSTYGALLVTAITGTDAVSNGGGSTNLGGYLITGANEQSLTYTPSSSDTFYGYIVILFTRLR